MPSDKQSSDWHNSACNELTEKHVNPLLKLLAYLNGPIPWMIEAAAIPVAMPTVLSVTMAVGARLLAVKQAIVSRLASIEELAGMDALCSDKTGTLTQNKLTLGEPFCIDGVSTEQVILAGTLASRVENQDTIDLAVLTGVKDRKQLEQYRVAHFQPFDPVHKRTEASVTGLDNRTFKVTKSAPLTRTRGPFWSSRPAGILLLAVVGTQSVATLIAVYGIFMPAIVWGWAAAVWGYAVTRCAG